MSTKRSLTDELQSVMLAHSFDAPEPTASIENILARTVAASAPVTVRRRRWFPSSTLIGAAAVVALLVGGVALLNSSRHESNKSSAGGNTAFSGRSDAKAAAGTVPPQQESNGSAGASPPHVPGPAVPPPACAASGAGAAIGTGYSAIVGTSKIPVTIADGYCISPNGSRTGSEVKVYRTTALSRTPVATLIRPEQQLHVDTIEQQGQTVVVRALDTRTGALNDYRFSTTSGTTFAAEPVTLVATACAKSTLDVIVRDGPVQAGVSVLLIDLRNHGLKPCVIEGYPDVAAAVTDQPAVTAQAIPHGKAGGSSSQSPPIVLLQPGAAGTAMIEYLTKPPANVTTPCESAKELTISLRGELLTTVPFGKSICTVQIHPVVSSPTGSD